MTKPTQLMAFNKGYKLVAVFSSYSDAAKIVGVSRQAITHCAKGEKILCAGLYWREIDHDFVVDNDDLNKLTLPVYDRATHQVRKGYKPWRNGKNNIIIISNYYSKSSN